MKKIILFIFFNLLLFAEFAEEDFREDFFKTINPNNHKNLTEFLFYAINTDASIKDHTIDFFINDVLLFKDNIIGSDMIIYEGVYMGYGDIFIDLFDAGNLIEVVAYKNALGKDLKIIKRLKIKKQDELKIKIIALEKQNYYREFFIKPLKDKYVYITKGKFIGDHFQDYPYDKDKSDNFGPNNKEIRYYISNYIISDV